MRISVIVQRLQFLIQTQGDMEGFMDVGPGGLLEIGEIDVDAEDTGIIFWPKEED
jgi:hypothetical protein